MERAYLGLTGLVERGQGALGLEDPHGSVDQEVEAGEELLLVVLGPGRRDLMGDGAAGP